MVEKKTTVVVEAKAKGFEKAKRDVKGTFEAMATKDANKGFKELSGLVAAMAKQFKGLTEGLKDYNKEMRSGGGGKEYKDQATQIRKLTEELDKLAKKKEASNKVDERSQSKRSQSKRSQSKRSFAMGVAQGSGIGEYFPEKGLRANIAGRYVGSKARAVGRFAATPFTGLQGMSAGLAGIPIVGGFMSGQLQNAMGASQQALGVRQQMMSMQGAVGQGGIGAAMRGASRPLDQIKIAQAGVLGGAAATASGNAMRERQAQNIADLMMGDDDVKNRLRKKSYFMSRQRQQDVDNNNAAVRADLLDTARQTVFAGGDIAVAEAQDAGRKKETARQRANNRARQHRAVSKATRKPLQNVTQAGLQYGAMGPQAALQFGQGFIQQRGGSLDDVSRSMLDSAFAAQTSKGIGGDIAGAFSRGTRADAGGLKTSAGSASSAFEKSIKDGMGLALSGSDLVNYMRQMAGAMGQWAQTGMSIDQDSVGRMGDTLGRSVGGIRGSNIAMGVMQAGQRMASGGGPQNASEFLLMQDVFGFGSRGGGAEDFAQSMFDMSAGVTKKGGLKKFIDRSRSDEPEKVQALTLSRRFGQTQTTVSPQDALKLIQGDKKTYDRIEGALKDAKGYDLKSDTDMRMDPALKEQGRQSTKTVAAGDRLIPTMQNLNAISTNMLKGFSSFSKEINSITKAMRGYSDDSIGVIDRIHKLLENAERFLGIDP